MGLFDQFVGGAAPPTEEELKAVRPAERTPGPAPNLPIPAARGMFDQFIGGAAPLPGPKTSFDAYKPGNFNRVFGELKPADVTPTQQAKWSTMEALVNKGYTPQRAQDIVEKGFNLGSSMTPMGAVLSAADYQHNQARGNWGSAALDAVGALPGAIALKRALPAGALGPRIRTGGAPDIIPAHEPPAWTRTDPRGGAYPPATVTGGTPHEQLGWVTPSQAELYGKGARPFAPPPPGGPGGMTFSRGTPAYVNPQGSAQQGYEVLANSPVRFDPMAGHDVAGLATQHISHPNIGGFDRYKAPDVHAELENFATSMAQRGTPVTPMDFELLRRRLRGMSDAPGANTANRPAGLAAADMLETYQAHPPAARVVAGTPADMAADRATLTQTRGDTRGGITAGTVEERIDRAGTRAGTTYSGGNLENATRQNLGALTTATGVRQIPGARPDELEDIWRASQGTPIDNWTRWGSKVLGGGGGMHQYGTATTSGGLFAAAAHSLGLDPASALAAGVAGGAGTAKLGSTLNRVGAERAVQRAEDVATRIRQHTPEYERRAALPMNTPVEDLSIPFRDRVTMMLMPGARDIAINEWNKGFVPEANQ